MRSFHRALAVVGLLLGLLLGFAVSVTPTAIAARNASGTYSLPSGNPVVTGTAISASWANTTLADLGTEVTNSLDRNGRGAMVAPLQLASGTASAPALTFSSEPGSGLYRASAGDVRLQVGGAQLQRWTATGSTFPLAMTVQGGLTASSAAASGTGGTFTGGSPNGTGVAGTGSGIGAGGTFTGGAGGGTGILANAGIAATATTRQAALTAVNGDISLASVTAPNANVAITKSVTPKNIVSAWARIATNGAGGVAVSDGFNVSGVTLPDSVTARVTFAAPFASINYACAAGGEALIAASAYNATTSTIDVSLTYLGTSPPSSISLAGAIPRIITLICTGAQ